MKVDFFDDDLNSSDRTLISLRESPSEYGIELLRSTVQVLEWQYRTYLDLTITDKLREVTLSPWSYNIDEE